MAEVLYPDMLTVCSSLELGETLVNESIDRYGLSAFHGSMRYATDVAAERMSVGMAELPDAYWDAEPGADCDGIAVTGTYPVHVAIRTRADRMEVHRSGNDCPAPTQHHAARDRENKVTDNT